MPIYRFAPSGQIDIEAESESEARKLFGDCHTEYMKDKKSFILVTPCQLVDVISDDGESKLNPR